MKIWKKFVLFTIAIIAIVLSCSRYYIVKNNFLHSIENVGLQNESKHILEKYTLENNIVKTIQDGEEVTKAKIEEYIKNLYTYMESDLESIVVYDEEYEQIYSNIGKIESLDVKEILNQDTGNYVIKEINNRNYMLFCSYWNVDNNAIYIVNMYDITEIYEERDRQISETLISDIVILTISAVTIFIFSIYLTKPISKLNKASKKIAEGNFKERVSIKSKDEIGELAKSFNTMADEVESKIYELKKQVKQKNDFITGFSHELKTPMTAIMGYSDMLRLKKCDEDVTRKALNYIYSETKRLSNLSHKLMILMSLTDEKIELKAIEIDRFIKKVSEKEEMSQNIKIEVKAEKAKVSGDVDLLECVLKNLIENARKAEPKDNKVMIIGENLENEKYRISVIDKGKGIPKEHIDRVTEEFYMIDKSRSRNSGGSGIGLALSQKILALHGSNVNIESKVDIGTNVYFELNRKQSSKK